MYIYNYNTVIFVLPKFQVYFN